MFWSKDHVRAIQLSADSSFAGKPVPGHLARAGSVLVRPARAGPALVHFAAGPLLVAPACSGFLPARPFGAFAHLVQV